MLEPLDGAGPLWLPDLLTPFEVSLSAPAFDDLLPVPELELDPLPEPMPLESFEELPLPVEDPDDELPMPEDEPDDEELATSMPSALAVFSSMRPVA